MKIEKRAAGIVIDTKRFRDRETESHTVTYHLIHIPTYTFWVV